MLEGMAGSPSRLDLLAGGCRESMRFHGERPVKITSREDLHPLFVALEQTNRHQQGHVHRRAGFELLKILQVHALILDAGPVGEAAPIRQLLDQRQLATLEVRRHAAAGPGVLALGALAGRRAAPRAEATADAPALAVRARCGCELMQLHSAFPSGPAATSSTSSRCWMANTMPRICGLSGRMTV